MRVLWKSINYLFVIQFQLMFTCTVKSCSIAMVKCKINLKKYLKIIAWIHLSPAHH